ncbi:hypothetical protein EV421DRAFT_1744680 [Armillaria borealis]|uniref:Uncharacterized protein n=1 Tax=Armillaria borealis TaxID=47425 RepID=A0AA39MCP1_9AGAR|nr:hypothetical protein EV421DRAFT_1744680 [Armillaria borealis]
MDRPRRNKVEKRSHSPTGVPPMLKKIKSYNSDASVEEVATDASLTVSSESDIRQSQPGKESSTKCMVIIQLCPIDTTKPASVPSGTEVSGIHLPSWVPVLQGNLQKLKRMLGYMFLKGTSHLHNLFLSDPSNFTVKSPKGSKKDKNSGRVVSRSAGNPTTSFFIVGKVVDSQLTAEESAKSIALQPFGRTIDRITAFLGVVSNMQDIILPISNQGLLFSTYCKDNNDYPVSNKKPGRSSHGPDVLSWKTNVLVPAFDGRKSFKLKDYWDLNSAPGGELGDLATALVIFTVTKYQTSSGSFRFGLNIQNESPLGIVNVVPYSAEADRPDFILSDDENDPGGDIFGSGPEIVLGKVTMFLIRYAGTDLNLFLVRTGYELVSPSDIAFPDINTASNTVASVIRHKIEARQSLFYLGSTVIGSLHYRNTDRMRIVVKTTVFHPLLAILSLQNSDFHGSSNLSDGFSCFF